MDSEDQDLRDLVMQLRAEKEHLVRELALARPSTPNFVPEPSGSSGPPGVVPERLLYVPRERKIQEPNRGTVNDWLREHQMRLQTAFDGAKERIQAAARLRKERNNQHVTGGSLTEDPAEPVGPITSEYGEEQGAWRPLTLWKAPVMLDRLPFLSVEANGRQQEGTQTSTIFRCQYREGDGAATSWVPGSGNMTSAIPRLWR
ncbi:hypothetical protein AAFF_G00422820 [Aldrovandia affinis]|uniref:Uncharacterized protein n=1 Tax=Aldrovandia affinis TaxID=143900 RepID=A0AAD7WZU5_9TELE|nr:hypothetical protein AAFF_G00422820 [Aldrovandia affinis]